VTSDVIDSGNPYAYPVGFDVERPGSQSRLTNFPIGIGFFIRGILLIPHFIVLYFLQIVAAILYFIATFAILFTGKYPEGMFNFVAGYVRWNANVNGYLLSFYDKYPPFSTEQQADYPLKLTVAYPAGSSRLLNFPLFIGMFIRVILVIPHLIILAFLGIAEFIVVFIAQFAILFSGSFPDGLHGFVVGVSRWSTRISAYLFGLTDRYPPFSTK
jgi:hypothetical protein